jgi:alternate signal-mediated exported protein
MNKSTKGALAAGAAGSLLLGGAGSLAYWTDTAPVGGADINSGHLKLVPVSGTGCDGWKLNTAPYVPTSDKIVPGDSLTQHCSYRVDMAGGTLKATVAVSDLTGTWGTASATALTGAISKTVAFKDAGGTPITGTTPVTNGYVVNADLTVGIPATADNTANAVSGLFARLNDITVTATQVP